MKKAALYARVSTNDGSQDTEVQLSQLRRYCKQRGLIVYKEYIDHISGTKEQRPGFQTLLADARQRRVDTVLVWKFDRFARSTKALITALEEFQALGIDFISFSEQVDTSTPMGKAMFTMIGAIAEFERSLIAERVSAGIAHARERGVRIGRPRTGFDVNRALTLKSEGWSWAEMAKALKVSSSTLRRTVYPLLKNHGTGTRAIPVQKLVQNP